MKNAGGITALGNDEHRIYLGESKHPAAKGTKVYVSSVGHMRPGAPETDVFQGCQNKIVFVEKGAKKERIVSQIKFNELTKFSGEPELVQAAFDQIKEFGKKFGNKDFKGICNMMKKVKL